MFGFFDFIFESVPSNRSTYCAYILLQSRESSKGTDDGGHETGAYVQGFYQLAKEGGLRCQIVRNTFDSRSQFKKAHPALYKQLYRTDAQGKVKRKNAFELAIVPEMNEDEILNIIRREYIYQNEHGLLPQSVFKVQMMKEWLGDLDKTKFKEAGNMSGATITIDNPDKNQKGSEKFLHSALQFIGFFSTVKTFFNFSIPFVLLISFSSLTPVAALAASIGLLFLFTTLHLSDQFGFSDMAEVLWNDLRWLTSKHFMKSKSAFSPSKAIGSACFLIAIAAFAAVGAQGAFVGLLALAAPVIGAGMAAYALAGILAGLSFMGACIGMMLPVRYMHGFGVFDNTIPVMVINKSVVPNLRKSKLPPSALANAPSKAERKNTKLKRCQQELKELKAVKIHKKQRTAA